MNDAKIKRVEQAAKERFEKSERVKMLMMCNTPNDYKDRLEASIQLALAQAEQHEAQTALDEAIRS